MGDPPGASQREPPKGDPTWSIRRPLSDWLRAEGAALHGVRVLASTHGVQVYHPSPEDLWRWTHAGLAKLFRDNADWQSLTVRPGAGTVACLGMLIANYHVTAIR